MSTTLKLPFKRFVAQVSTGEPRPKSSYLALMAENLEALKACPWREAGEVPVALADHDFTKASHFSDAYDAFKMTGAWDSKTQRETAFAGMAAYRFKIPSAASSVAISSVTLPISRDRFLLGGARVAAVRSNSATPSANWSVVTGAGASAYLANSAANLLASKPADGTLTIETPAGSGGYLWIYLTLEDYTDWWELYSATEARQYAIEGSAMLAGGSAEVTFASDVTADGAAPEFNVTRAMAAHGRQGRTFKFAAERLSNGWKVPEAIAVRSFAQPTTTTVGLSSTTNDPLVFAADGNIPSLLCTAFVSSVKYNFNETVSGSSHLSYGYASSQAFTFFWYAGELRVMYHRGVSGSTTRRIDPHYIPTSPVSSFDLVEADAQRADANAEVMRQLLSSEAWIALRTGKAHSIAAEYVGQIDFLNTTGSPQGVWLYFVLLVGTDNGVKTLGIAELSMLSPSSRSGSLTFLSDSSAYVANVGGPATIFPTPNDIPIADAAGRADLMLPSLRTYNYNFTFTYTSGSTRQTMSIQKAGWIDNGTVCVGLDGNKLTVNGQEIPVDGTICGICRVYDGSHRAFAVYGDLVSVGGVLCRNMAVVTVDSGINISVPSFDASITPNTYGHYRITSTPTANNAYLITGDFESLGSTAYHGHAKISTSNGNLAVGADGLISVASASTAHPTDSLYLYNDLSCLWMTGGYSSSSVHKPGDLPATEADAAATAAGLRAVYGDVYDGMLAPTGETADGAGFEVACVARTFALSTGSSATRKVWTVDASALLVPFSAPTGFRATKVRLDWSATAADPNGLASIVTGDAVPAPKFALWLMRGRRVEEADGLTARELWDASAGESGGWELVGTVAASATTATLDLACPLADAVGTFLLTAWAPQDGLNPAAESTVDETTTPATVTEYGVSGWRPDITLIG